MGTQQFTLALVGVSVAAVLLLPSAASTTGITLRRMTPTAHASQFTPAAPDAQTRWAYTVPGQPTAPTAADPAKPHAESVEEQQQKCHIKFFPLVKHRLEHSDLVKLQIIADVDCREAIGDLSLFAEGRLVEKLEDILDDAVTVHGARIMQEKDLQKGVCVDVEVDSANRETHWGQCFFAKEILEVDEHHNTAKGGMSQPEPPGIQTQSNDPQPTAAPLAVKPAVLPNSGDHTAPVAAAVGLLGMVLGLAGTVTRLRRAS